MMIKSQEVAYAAVGSFLYLFVAFKGKNYT